MTSRYLHVRTAPASGAGRASMIVCMAHPRRRAEMFVAAAEDPRLGAPATGDEQTMLMEFLRSQRATLGIKCVGVETELSRRSVEPSTLSLLGLAHRGVCGLLRQRRA